MTAQRHAQASEQAAWTTEQVRIALAIAHRQASREARRFRLDRADRDDLAQDLLVAMVARRALYDPSAGSWQGFLQAVAWHAVLDRRRARRRAAAGAAVALELDLFPDGASATSEGARAPDLALDLQRVAAELPAGPASLLRLIHDVADVAAAQRTAAMSSSVFYRALGDLRCWLRASGLHRPDARLCRKPTQAVAAHA
jgi:DNA-directed RNA polymerase specialized sigma24 family protein